MDTDAIVNIVERAIKSTGFLDDDRIKKAVETQMQTKQRLGSLFVKLGYVSNENLGLKIIPQIGIVPASIKSEDIEKRTLNFLPKHIAFTHRVVPLRREDDAKLILGTDDPVNFLAHENLQDIIGSNVELKLVRSQDVDKILNELYVFRTIVTKRPAVYIKKEDEPTTFIEELTEWLIIEAVNKRATEVHIEPLERELRVRYRIDGVLVDGRSLPKRMQALVQNRLKMIAGISPFEGYYFQGEVIKKRIASKGIDLKIFSLPTLYGETIVLRILENSSELLIGIEDLGQLPPEIKALERLITLPNGIILVTGTKGSGKTTTLYALLNHINHMGHKIITIEDRISNQLEGITQVQADNQIGMTFSNCLKTILRQGSDIIMVGDVQDKETAYLSIQSAITGHLVFGGLQMNSVTNSVARLFQFGVKPYLLASTLQGILLQDLVRMLCPCCREPYSPSLEEKRELSLDIEDVKGFNLYRSRGCPHCNNTGFKGRLGIFELLIITDEIRDMVLNNASMLELYRKARQMGMKTLREDGLEKAIRGDTTIEEVLRVTE